MNTAITYVAVGILLVLLIWLLAFLVIRKIALRGSAAGPMGISDVKSAGQLAFSWAITLASIMLTGLTLIIVGSMQSPRLASQIMDFLYMFGGIIMLAVFMPIVWLMARNKQLEARNPPPPSQGIRT